MLIKIQWTVTRSVDGHPAEYYAQLPSGAIAYARSHQGIWLGLVQLRGTPDRTAIFGTAYDARMAIESEEVRRLIDLGIQTAAANRDRFGPHTASRKNTAHIFLAKRAEGG